MDACHGCRSASQCHQAPANVRAWQQDVVTHRFNTTLTTGSRQVSVEEVLDDFLLPKHLF